MNFAKTRIYARALELVSLSQRIIAELPAGCGFLADQLRRAAASIALNFAEGHDKPSRAEQRRYFRTASGSAAECAAIFDVAARLGAITAEHHRAGRDLCDHLVRMLSRFRAP
jgi:four helix bundle protein